MTKNKRYTVPVPPELEEQIIKLRKSDEYCMLSFSEIMRRLLVLGLEHVNAQAEE